MNTINNDQVVNNGYLSQVKEGTEPGAKDLGDAVHQREICRANVLEENPAVVDTDTDSASDAAAVTPASRAVVRLKKTQKNMKNKKTHTKKKQHK